MADNKLFSIQGRVYLGDRGSSGKLINPVWVGDANLTVEMSTETIKHKESFSGFRMLYGKMAKSKAATVNLQLFEFTKENLALGLYASEKEFTAGTVTSEAFPSGLVDNQVVVLDHGRVSALVITAGGAALAEGVDWRLERPEAGHVRILNAAAFTGTVTAAYEYRAVTKFGMFTQTPPERWLQMVGVNTLNDQSVVVDLFRVQFDPAANLPLHNDEFGSFELKGSALVDPMLVNQGDLGGFGSIEIDAEVG